jgi:formate dehydrogenase subunit gamma
MSSTGQVIERVQEICAARQNRPDALIEILHDVQESLGHLPKAAIQPIADMLNLSRAEVFGVVSFYHDFRTAPASGPVVKLCRAESCQAMGCDALAETLAGAVDWKGNAPEIRTVYCLGNCALSPAAMVGDRLIGRADIRKIAEAVATARECRKDEHHG